MPRLSRRVGVAVLIVLSSLPVDAASKRLAGQLLRTDVVDVVDSATGAVSGVEHALEQVPNLKVRVIGKTADDGGPVIGFATPAGFFETPRFDAETGEEVRFRVYGPGVIPSFGSVLMTEEEVALIDPRDGVRVLLPGGPGTGRLYRQVNAVSRNLGRTPTFRVGNRKLKVSVFARVLDLTSSPYLAGGPASPELLRVIRTALHNSAPRWTGGRYRYGRPEVKEISLVGGATVSPGDYADHQMIFAQMDAASAQVNSSLMFSLADPTGETYSCLGFMNPFQFVEGIAAHEIGHCFGYNHFDTEAIPFASSMRGPLGLTPYDDFVGAWLYDRRPGTRKRDREPRLAAQQTQRRPLELEPSRGGYVTVHVRRLDGGCRATTFRVPTGAAPEDFMPSVSSAGEVQLARVE